MVEWTFTLDGVSAKITEFQNVYTATGFLDGTGEVFLRWLHQKLEDDWWEELVNSAGDDPPVNRRPY